MSLASTTENTAKSEKLPAMAHLACGWPLILVAIGGLIGGALGGGAYGLNLAIYKSKIPTAAKVVLNVLTGFAAFATWALIAGAIQSALKN